MVTSDEVSTYQADSGYTVQQNPRNETQYLVTSKTKTDNLPLLSFRVEEEPCVSEKAGSTSKRKSHPVELINEAQTCQEDKAIQGKADSRYIDSQIADISYLDLFTEADLKD